ncbi:MAG: ion channel [Acidimicrobiales bacterium]
MITGRRDAERRTWLLRWMDRWIDPGLLFLAAATVPVLLVETMSLSASDERLVNGVEWAIWAAFAANFAARLLIAVDRRRQARELAWDLLVVVGQPALLLANLVGGITALRAAVVATRSLSRGAAFRRLWGSLRQDPLRVLAGIAPLLWLLSSALLLRAERGHGGISSIGDALWWGAATLATVGYGDVSPTTGTGRLVAVLTMVSGIGMFSIVTAKFAETLVSRRAAGHGRTVRVRDHTVVLGWSPRVFSVVGELLLAHESGPRHTVVVLAERDRAIMARELFDHLPHLARSNLTVVCRTGAPGDPAVLGVTRIEDARSVIVIGDGSGDESVVRILLGLLTRPQLGAAPVVSEVTDAATAAALLDAFPDRLALIQSDAFIARLTAQSCRLPGVALAYEELLSFRGSQLYLHREPAAVGLPLGDVVCGFVDACVIGLHDAGGVIELSPPMDRLVGEDDQLIVIAHAADRITWAGPGPAPSAPAPLAVVEGGEDIVVCGWNHLAPRIVDERDHYLPVGSSVTVLVDERHRRTATRALPARLAHGTVVVDSAAGDAHSTLVHDRCRGADHVVILSPDDATSATDADARALVQMLAVREVLTRAARSATPSPSCSTSATPTWRRVPAQVISSSASGSAACCSPRSPRTGSSRPSSPACWRPKAGSSTASRSAGSPTTPWPCPSVSSPGSRADTATASSGAGSWPQPRTRSEASGWR